MDNSDTLVQLSALHPLILYLHIRSLNLIYLYYVYIRILYQFEYINIYILCILYVHSTSMRSYTRAHMWI